MKAHQIKGKLLAGMTMAADDRGKLGWVGSPRQWQTAREYSRMCERLRTQRDIAQTMFGDLL